jgi:hypothetical protein
MADSDSTIRLKQTGIGARRPSLVVAKAAPTSLVDHTLAYASYLALQRSKCGHGCGPLALQESPRLAGDDVRTVSRLPICWRQRPFLRPIDTDTKTLPLTPDYKVVSMLNFPYEPLMPDKDAIRLVDLYPSTRDGIVNLKFRDALLSDTPYYYALSYEWGSRDDEEVVLVDGYPMKVRRNLHAFLQQASRLDIIQTLWIDFICINQDDIDERDRQVQMMGDIYQTATSVVVWLGPDAAESGHLLHHLRQTGRCLRSFWHKGFNNFTSEGSDNDLRIVEFEPILSTPPILHSDQIDALRHLLHRSYWARAWIVQELVLARDITLYCGDQIISWSYMKALQSILHQDECFENTIIVEIFEHRLVLEHGKTDLLGTLERYPHRLCFDPRDQVYSLLSLDFTYKDGRRLIEVDYSIDLRSLLLRAFNSSSSSRTVANFEHLRLALGLTWPEVLDANPPRYTKGTEPWLDPEHPLAVYAQVGSYGQVKTVHDGAASEYNGLLAVTSDGELDSSLPWQHVHFSPRAEVGDHIFGFFGTQFRMAFRIVEERWTFVSPLIETNAKRGKTFNFAPLFSTDSLEYRILMSNIFPPASVEIGWLAKGANVFARLRLDQWAAITGCLTGGEKFGRRLPVTAGQLPASFWETES